MQRMRITRVHYFPPKGDEMFGRLRLVAAHGAMTTLLDQAGLRKLRDRLPYITSQNVCFDIEELVGKYLYGTSVVHTLLGGSTIKVIL